MTATDHIDRAVSHLVAAKAYAVSPRYVVEGVAELSDALMARLAAEGRLVRDGALYSLGRVS